MRLIVTGDFHIKESRIPEIEGVFSQISEHLKECDGIVILGDIYNHAVPNDKEIACFVSFINNLPSSKMIYIISGNHDTEKTNNAISWIKSLRPYNILYNKHCITTNIMGKKAMMLHASVSESRLGPEDFQLGGTSYKEYDADILLLGHIHKSQVVGETPLTIHPGSPYYINFGERNDKKGIYILNISEEITYQFIPLKVRAMQQLNVTSEELEKLDLNNIDKDVKLKIVFNIKSFNLEKTNQVNEIIKKCREKFETFKYDFKVEKQSISIEEVKNKKQESIDQLLNKFCEENKIDKEVQKLLIKLLH